MLSAILPTRSPLQRLSPFLADIGELRVSATHYLILDAQAPPRYAAAAELMSFRSGAPKAKKNIARRAEIRIRQNATSSVRNPQYGVCPNLSPV